MSDIFKLEPNEIVDLQFRRHWIIFAGRSVWTVLSAFLPLIVIPFLLQTGVIPSGTDIRLISFGTALWLLIVWCALAVIWTDYYLDIWYVTDKRVISIDQVALFNRVVSSWGIERIVEVTVHTENFVQTLLGYGTIQIQTAGPTGEHMRAAGIPRPERVREAIVKRLNGIEMIEKKAKEQNELLHVVSHEAKGFLSKDAAALAAIAESDSNTSPGDMQKLATRALQETRNGVSTMMSLLGSTTAQNKSKTSFDGSKAARDAVEAFVSTAAQKGLSLKSSLGDAITVSGDEMRIRELVFKALIDNAIRYTLTGGLMVTLTKDRNEAQFVVEDTGVGMNQSDMSKLFSDGGHGEHSKDLNAESTGYGLSTAKKVVADAGGEIHGESEGPGRGSKFVVRLPIS